MARGRRITGETEARDAWWRVLREKLSLPGVEAWSNSTRTIFLNALFLLAFIVVLPVLVGQFRRNEVVIEAIAVPEALVAQGLTPDVAASRIWDGLQDVTLRARTAKETIAAIPNARRVEFSFPDSGFSIESLVFHVRKLFNAYETRIAGEITCAEASCERSGMQLRLRVVRDNVEVIEMPPLGAEPEREYFASAAARVLGQLDPFVAIAASAESEPVVATTLARRLIRAHHKDAKWAHNLVGIIRMNGGDLVSAQAEFTAALDIDRWFLPARVNLGQALLRAGDRDGAAREVSTALSIDKRYVPAIDGQADIALASGKPDEAVARLNEAAAFEPNNPLFFAKAGKIELDRGRKAEGVALMRRSLEIDPGYALALASLALLHYNEGDIAAAEKLYRDAADYAPKDAEAQADDGRLLAMLKDWEGALKRYSTAAALEPRQVGYRTEQAKCLQALNRHDEALVVLAEAKGFAPADAELALAEANSLRDTNRNAEAIAAYKRFLELDRTDSVMRPVAERFIALLSS